MRHGWCLDRAAWASATALDAGRQWSRRRFRLVDRSAIPDASGIYVLASGVAAEGLLGQLYNALYVGQAKSLRQRYLQHLARPSPDVRRAVHTFGTLDYWWTLCAEPDLDALEARLIHCLGPTANRQAGITARIGDPISLGNESEAL